MEKLNIQKVGIRRVEFLNIEKVGIRRVEFLNIEKVGIRRVGLRWCLLAPTSLGGTTVTYKYLY